MRLGIKGKQVLGVTSIVGTVVVVLSVLHLVSLARVSLAESQARAELLTGAIYSRAREVIVPGVDPFEALRRDPGLRSMLASSLLAKNVTFAVIADPDGLAAVHADPALEGQPLPAGGDLRGMLAQSWWSQIRAIYVGQGTNLEFRQPLLLGDREFGSIRVGVSTLLIRSDLNDSLSAAVVTAFVALAVAVLVATLLAQLLLRPIHVLRGGLTRLGRGELGVQLDLHQDDEFGELGTFFNTVSEQLSADRLEMVGQMANLESAEYANQLQATIRYARKLTALGRLSAGVAHEVKNPLHAMMIHLELLRQQVAPAAPRGSAKSAAAVADAPIARAEAMQHVDVIAHEIRRLDEVVQGFLKFTRPEDLKLQPLALRALIDQIVPIVRPEADRAHVQLVVECDEAPEVNGDSAMLRQAFLNLALNACQAMPDGGTLRIRCEAARPSKGSERRASITFTDTGVGIEPANLQRIFELYFTTKEKGSGIGLSMVYRTVQMHDGEIEVESTPGSGTTFRVLLPQV
jgi:signal transduction histidine kinase